MKVIVCSGDSHTCGEGATGFDSSPELSLGVYNTNGKGSGRYSGKDARTYVNLVREAVCSLTDSQYTEVDYPELSKLYEMRTECGFMCVEKSIALNHSADMITLEFAEKKKPATVLIYTDGVFYQRLTLHAEITRHGEWSFYTVPIFCAGTKTLEIVPESGKVYLGRVGYHKGEYAVINSGVGSCTTKRYREECLSDFVIAFQPEIVIAEAHTINDWISGITPEQYKENLKSLLIDIKKTARKVYVLGVSPIMGTQEQAGGLYQDFMIASKIAAEKAGVEMIDTYQDFLKETEGLSDKERFEKLYHDNWHVNDLGHRIYADNIIKKIGSVLK